MSFTRIKKKFFFSSKKREGLVYKINTVSNRSPTSQRAICILFFIYKSQVWNWAGHQYHCNNTDVCRHPHTPTNGVITFWKQKKQNRQLFMKSGIDLIPHLYYQQKTLKIIKFQYLLILTNMAWKRSNES